MLRTPVIVLAVCVGAAGCSSGPERPKLVPASGTVVYKKQPVRHALVAFIPLSAEGRAEAAQGMTDENGAFTLACPNYGPGATPGKYKVTLTFYGSNAPISDRYSAPDKTTLRADVPPEGSDKIFVTFPD